MEVLPSNDVKDGKILAIISHFWVIGLLISWVLNLKKNNTFTSFYTRQMIGWNLLTFLNTFIILKVLRFDFLKWIFGIILLIFWFISLFGAISGEKKLMPYIGEKIQDFFRSL